MPKLSGFFIWLALKVAPRGWEFSMHAPKRGGGFATVRVISPRQTKKGQDG